MAERIENVQTVPGADYPVPQEEEAQEPAAHPYDTEDAEAKRRKLLNWYNQEREKQAINRYQQAIDDDFYDHLQWDSHDVEELHARGQAALVFNEVKGVVDWIIGTERRTRIDYKILPREDDDVEGALIKTKLMKYVDDVNHSPFHRSRGFSEAVRSGVGWLECGICLDPESEPLYDRMESWRNVLYDSNSLEPDLSDARYLFRWRWIDLDIAQAAFPERKDRLKESAIASELFGPEQDEDLWYIGQRLQERDTSGAIIARRTYIDDALFINNRRERVKLIECWYKEPTTVKTMYGDSPLHGKDFNPNNADHAQARKDGTVTLYDRLYMKMRCAIMTEGFLIYDGASPYRHNKFPLTPIWAYRRKRDNAPYGVVRGIRDPQEDLNKRASKAQYILATKGVIADKGAFDDEDQAREEIARPDYFLVKNAGKEVKVDRDVQLAQEHINLMEQDSLRIRQAGGVTGENLGMETNATSGKAIVARQTQGTVVTTELFDNLLLATQLHGEKRLSLIEQYYSDAKTVRLTNSRGKPEFVKINQYDEASDSLLNDITARQADFIVGEQDWQQSLRIAMFESMFEMTGRMPPEIALKFLDLVFELSDLPNKDEMVSRIRAITGMVPPGEKLSPEEQAQQDAMNKERQEAKAKQDALLNAQIEKLVAEVQRLRSEVEKNKAATAATNVDTQGKAVEVGGTIAAIPGVAQPADAVLESAGYPDSGGTPAPTPGA